MKIKFRAINPLTEKLQEVFAIEMDSERLTFDGSEYFSFEETKPQQFTGLKDRKGVEIFEGDIVEDENSINKGIVKYFINPDPQGAFTACFNVELSEEEAIGLDSRFKVIGNIYNNPNLLKK